MGLNIEIGHVDAHIGLTLSAGNTRDMVVKIVEVAAEADLLPLLCTCTFFVAEFISCILII